MGRPPRCGRSVSRCAAGRLNEAAARCAQAVALLPHLERPLQWWDVPGLPVWRARTLRDLATALRLLDRDEDSDRAWREASETFKRHGSREAREPRPQAALPRGNRRSEFLKRGLKEPENRI